MARRTLLLLLLAACTPAQPEPVVTPDPTPVPAAAAAPAVAAMPAAGIVGEYTTTLTAADLPAAMPDSMKSGTAGAWQIALHEGNHLVVTYNGRAVVQGPYQVSGNQITFGPGETGEYACNVPGTYTWQTSGNQITFTRVQDTCQGRILVLTTRPLTRR